MASDIEQMVRQSNIQMGPKLLVEWSPSCTFLRKINVRRVSRSCFRASREFEWANLLYGLSSMDQESFWNGQRNRGDGGVEWFRNGVLHRENGPAVVAPDGSTYWYADGKLHRDDGPAIEYPAVR